MHVHHAILPQLLVTKSHSLASGYFNVTNTKLLHGSYTRFSEPCIHATNCLTYALHILKQLIIFKLRQKLWLSLVLIKHIQYLIYAHFLFIHVLKSIAILGECM